MDENGRYTLPAEYVQAVCNAGGMPVLLPPTEVASRNLLCRLDGVILTGGGDVSPKLYGGNERHIALYGQSAVRDEFEWRLIDSILAYDIPLLGICRGMQLLNVYLGGTLHEHLPDIFGEQLPHRSDKPGPILHPVSCDPRSRLGGILGESEFEVASWHHQAVDRIGSGLTVAAWASDGVVEAIELAQHRWCVAVQWHPELPSAGNRCQEALWLGFVSACEHYNRHNIE
ncbi:gamma-glutamyl-gamma-aminobutyrate hydrolase family protein [Acidithiobacillus sp. AMEEHan]|uniref:gamma-glutamyl-gamma-aminobutyrate hydrolase family protein n=1 Tax=Acidithiobacillus sp. AMEEHan TaxID=2994951 RepID=UPI0027E50ED6|nr:gamma-glutamyl-gamma-aminobutyrate hydrolase family protein [Acidithiobacillus sp. AMEEHan]